MFVEFAGVFMHLKSSRFEFLLASDTLWHGINQEKEKENKPEAPEPLAHAGASTQRPGVTLENGLIFS